VLANTLVNDRLPAGFVYVSGSARLNGAPLADPAGGGGPALRFSLGGLVKGAQATLSYRVRVGVGAQGTTGVNAAQAVSGGVVSNRASASVQVKRRSVCCRGLSDRQGLWPIAMQWRAGSG